MIAYPGMATTGPFPFTADPAGPQMVSVTHPTYGGIPDAAPAAPAPSVEKPATKKPAASKKPKAMGKYQSWSCSQRLVYYCSC